MKVHLIGIGGIGVSALAQYYLSKGHEVFGSDLVVSEITNFLKEKGIKIFIGNDAKNISKDLDLAVYSPAVEQNNQELLAAKELKTRCQSYPEALGELTKQYFTIAVSGTHGKSTTTSMIGLLLAKAGLDPTVIVGTKLKEFGDSNFRAGKSEYLVIEADEYFASFLNYWPKIIVLTTLEADHLDYYKTLENLLKTFKEYIGHLQVGGVLIANGDDENINKITENILTNKFSIKQPETEKIRQILQIPGEHNVSNALAALAVARILKIPDEISFKSLAEFKGTWRRFDIKQLTVSNKQLTIVSDYGHHPTEIKVTLKSAREKYPNRRIWCVFQPHQHQRTYYLFNDFVKVFRQVPIDKIIITDIYSVAGRETGEIKKKVSSEKLVKKINRPEVIYLPKNKIKNYLKEKLRDGEVLIIMGAGDIYDFEKELES